MKVSKSFLQKLSFVSIIILLITFSIIGFNFTVTSIDKEIEDYKNIKKAAQNKTVTINYKDQLNRKNELAIDFSTYIQNIDDNYVYLTLPSSFSDKFFVNATKALQSFIDGLKGVVKFSYEKAESEEEYLVIKVKAKTVQGLGIKRTLYGPRSSSIRQQKFPTNKYYKRNKIGRQYK
jgi:hypothetical protein